MEVLRVGWKTRHPNTMTQQNSKMFGLGARHRVAMLGFFGFFNVYAMVSLGLRATL